MKLWDNLKKNAANIIGKSTGFIASLTFGASAGGFILGFAIYFGFKTSAPLWLQSIVYSGAGFIGINAFYRMWRVITVGTPNGLKLMFNQKIENNNSDRSDNNEQSIQTSNSQLTRGRKALKFFGVVLSFAAAATYGGLSYLGISHILDLPMLWWEITSGVIIIGSNFIAAGGLFSYAWIQNINEGTLFAKNKEDAGKIYNFFQIVSSLFALFGLGCTMMLGSFGLAESIAKVPAVSKLLATIIATIGFFGEAPFTIKQGRLLVFKISKIKALCAKDQVIDNTSYEDYTIKNKKCTLSDYGKVTSSLLYMAGYIAGTYTNIGNYSSPLKAVFAASSGYLALVSCLEEDEEEFNSERYRLVESENPSSHSDPENKKHDGYNNNEDEEKETNNNSYTK